jgi:CheY-specific phosphatase CheX
MENHMLDQMTLNDTVIDAAREVFETMIFMDVETRSEACPIITGQALLGSITFKGTLEGCLALSTSAQCSETLDGCLAVCVSQFCAERIAKNMLGMEPDESLGLDETCDAIGEVSNMVMGSIKTRVQDIYPGIEVSIPSVIMGRELKNNLGEKAVKAVVCAWLDEQDVVEFSFLYREAKR